MFGLRSPLVTFGCLLALTCDPTVSGEDTARFDFYYLVLNWPGGFCMYNRCAPSTHLINDFHIFGFWSGLANSERAVRYCHEDPQFDARKVEALRERLEAAWPDPEGGNVTEYWRRQWAHYGGCNPRDLPDEEAYFRTALDFYEELRLMPWLQERGHSPSLLEQHDTHAVMTSFVRGVGVRPQLFCDPVDEEHHLKQIRFCVSRTGAFLHDCPHGGNCRGDMYIPELGFSPYPSRTGRGASTSL